MSLTGNSTMNLTTDSSLNSNSTGLLWDTLTAVNIAITASALTTNGVVLLTILCTKCLRTAFSIYLIYLMSSNILLLIMQNIPDLLNHLFSSWPLGDAYCTVYELGIFLMQGCTQSGHNLIAINRIWAVYFPHSYRTLHNRKVAVLMCSAAFVVIACFMLPGVVQDTMYYRADPTVNGCSLNLEIQWTWATTVQFAVYNLGVVIMWVTYPMIWYKRRQSQRISRGTKIAAVNLPKPPTDGTTAPLVKATGLNAFADNSKHLDVVVDKISMDRKVAKSSMLLLTVLTVSVTLCWTPSNALYTMMLWPPYDQMDQGIVSAVDVMFSMQSVVDPILFVCSLSYLRKAFPRCEMLFARLRKWLSRYKHRVVSH